MKQFASLCLVVLALAAVPAALADDTAPPAVPQAQQGQRPPGVRLRLEIVRLRLRLVHLRYRVACQDQGSDACAKFTEQAVERLTALDEKVQGKLDDLQCAADSSEKKCTVLVKLDERIERVLAKLQGSEPPPVTP